MVKGASTLVLHLIEVFKCFIDMWDAMRCTVVGLPYKSLRYGWVGVQCCMESSCDNITAVKEEVIVRELVENHRHQFTSAKL